MLQRTEIYSYERGTFFAFTGAPSISWLKSPKEIVFHLPNFIEFTQAICQVFRQLIGPGQELFWSSWSYKIPRVCTKYKRASVPFDGTFHSKTNRAALHRGSTCLHFVNGWKIQELKNSKKLVETFSSQQGKGLCSSLLKETRGIPAYYRSHLVAHPIGAGNTREVAIFGGI